MSYVILPAKITKLASDQYSIETDLDTWKLTIKQEEQEKLKQTGQAQAYVAYKKEENQEEMKAKYIVTIIDYVQEFDLGSISYLDMETRLRATTIEIYTQTMYKDLPNKGQLLITKNNEPIFSSRVEIIRARYIASKDTERLELKMCKI